MQKVSSFLTNIGIFLFFACPVYQLLDSWIKNKDGDGITVSGDNPIFKNILGVKTTYHWFVPSSGWEETGDWVIQTPPWMQSIGLPKKVTYGNDVYGEPSTDKTSVQLTVWGLRWMVKLLIPGVFLFFGCVVNPLRKEKILHTQAL